MGELPPSAATDVLLTVAPPAYSATSPSAPLLLDPPLHRHPPPTYPLHSIAALWAAGHTPAPRLAALAPSVRAYHARQNGLLRRCAAAALATPLPHLSAHDWGFLRSLPDLGLSEDDARRPDARVERAIVASNVCNVILLVAQLLAFLRSGSMSMLAVFVDAMLDTVSGAVVWVTWGMKSCRDKHRYPVGRARLEPLGVIGMACLMTAATMVALEQAVGTLIAGGDDRFVGLSVGVGAVLLGALTVKAMLYWYCQGVGDVSVAALAEDHFNDCLSNGVSFCTVLLAQHLVWWLDPLGGIIISCLIIRNWLLHTLEHCDQLLGKAAGVEVISVLTFMACNHHPEVMLVDTVRAYHVGQGLYAEVDIVLAEEMPLWKAHDIGESLQTRIEGVEGVERCFVHIDTEAKHSPHVEHKEI